ncbi:MAG: alpha/beta hydrolase [Candidatus Omnitrophica bacterium]|nr:alpha/beta hydrolase [Candidatus Omnitrophota bacterium]
MEESKTESQEPEHEAKAPAKRRPWWKRVLYGLLLLLILCIVGLWVAKQAWDSRFFEGYDPELALNVQEVSKEQVNGDWREKLTIQTLPGEQVPIVFHYPDERPEGGAPCLVLLYGIGQNLKFLDEIARFYVRDGYAILGIEQLGQGERKPKQKQTPLQGLLSLRQRSGQTIVETKRVVDFLETRPEVDMGHLYLFGVSMGAMMGASALAMEPRFDGGILMWGGGDLPKMVSENRNAKIEMKPYQRWIAAAAATLFKPVEPLKRIDRISPRPLLFQNALHDEIVPKVCTEAYYERAGEPKEILWYDCGHENGLNEQLIRQIIGDQIDWLKTLTG